MVRRATAALLGTVAGTALLVGAKYAQPQIGGANDTATVDPGTALDPGAEASASTDPSATASPGASGTPGNTVPVGGPTSTPTGGAKPTATKTTASCKTVKGDPSPKIVSPGAGTVTVTIKVCGGAITASTGVVANGNWDINTKAMTDPEKGLNVLVVKYYKTGLSATKYTGATLTSDAYKLSFASAKSKAGV